MDRYKDYYIYRYDYQELDLMGFPGMSPDSYSRIWFGPFQKAKLLNKIKEDIKNILTDVQLSYKNATIDYVISDDLRNVMIYIDNYDTYMRLRYDYSNPNEIDLKDEIGRRVVLYHDLLGGVDDLYYGDIVVFEYVGSESEKEKWTPES